MITLRLTEKQHYIVEMYIFDLCNVEIDKKYSIADLQAMEENDQMRISLYSKFNKLTFSCLTRDDLIFLADDVEHYTSDGFDRERATRVSGSALVRKVRQLLDKSTQRSQAIESILS